MKKLLKLTLTFGLLLSAILSLSACSDQWDTPYGSLDEQGYTVSVKYDANGGVFAGTNNVTVIDVFSPENAKTNIAGEKEFRLLSPDDPLRKEGAFSISRPGYFLAGWYTERSLRTDANGEPLDEYGVKTALSGGTQGYTYAGRWDFDSDVLTVKPEDAAGSESPVMTLYAAWIPYFDYEFYAKGENGFELVGSVELIDLPLPEWSESTGKLDLRRFPDLGDKTFEAAYLDESLSTALTETIDGTKFVDYESGTTTTDTVKVYTTWLDGTWYKIHTAKQFTQNSRLGGNYIICADLDFEGAIWSTTLATGKFTGQIVGNGYKFSNIRVTQADNTQLSGGIFGTIDAGARISDLTLENVTYTVGAGSRMQGASFGLLAGTVSSDAVLENVSVSGTLLVSGSIPETDYRIGLLCGTGSVEGIDLSMISCRPTDDSENKISVEAETDGTVTVTFITNPS